MLHMYNPRRLAIIPDVLSNARLPPPGPAYDGAAASRLSGGYFLPAATATWLPTVRLTATGQNPAPGLFHLRYSLPSHSTSQCPGPAERFIVAIQVTRLYKSLLHH